MNDSELFRPRVFWLFLLNSLTTVGCILCPYSLNARSPKGIFVFLCPYSKVFFFFFYSLKIEKCAKM